MVCLELAWLFTEERRAMSKKVLLDPSTGLEDRNARPEVVAAKLHEMAEHCGGNALVIGPTERGVLWNHLARVLIPAAERCERIAQGDPGPAAEEQERTCSLSGGSDATDGF